MGYTALGAQLPEQKQAWVKESIKTFRENFFFTKFTGDDDNSIVQVVTELTSTETGDRAGIGLVQELSAGGIVGDNNIDGRREALESTWVEIHCDQLRKSVGSKGRVDDQRSIFKFRKESKNKLAYWRAKMVEELTILTASGISYAYNVDGSTRVVGAEDALTTLDYAADVTAPSSARFFRYTGSALAAGDTTAIDASSVPKYGMVVDMMAMARVRGIKPLMIGGKEHYAWLCHPFTLARLKKDADFREAVLQGAARGTDHPIFTGATVTMDGLIIHTNNRVFNTAGATSGSKWGATGVLDGTRSLLMGCQAFAFAELWGSADWFEGKEDDGAKNVVTVSMYNGLLKPRFTSRFDSDTVQDFGLMVVDLLL